MAKQRVLDNMGNPVDGQDNQSGAGDIGGLIGAGLPFTQSERDPSLSRLDPMADPRTDAQSGESGRDRAMLRSVTGSLGGGASSQSAPARPKVPTPEAGGVSPVQSGGSTGASAQLRTFAPMKGPSGDIGASATPGASGLFGAKGGLTGGGLGLPLDAVPDERSDDIYSLIQQLMARKG